MTRINQIRKLLGLKIPQPPHTPDTKTIIIEDAEVTFKFQAADFGAKVETEKMFFNGYAISFLRMQSSGVERIEDFVARFQANKFAVINDKLRSFSELRGADIVRIKREVEI